MAESAPRWFVLGADEDDEPRKGRAKEGGQAGQNCQESDKEILIKIQKKENNGEENR